MYTASAVCSPYDRCACLLCCFPCAILCAFASCKSALFYLHFASFVSPKGFTQSRPVPSARIYTHRGNEHLLPHLTSRWFRSWLYCCIVEDFIFVCHTLSEFADPDLCGCVCNIGCCSSRLCASWLLAALRPADAHSQNVGDARRFRPFQNFEFACGSYGYSESSSCSSECSFGLLCVFSIHCSRTNPCLEEGYFSSWPARWRGYEPDYFTVLTFATKKWERSMMNSTRLCCSSIKTCINPLSDTHSGRQTHTHTCTNAQCREKRWGDFRAFTSRAGVRLSEPWTAHMKLTQCGPPSPGCCSIIVHQ